MAADSRSSRAQFMTNPPERRLLPEITIESLSEYVAATGGKRSPRR